MYINKLNYLLVVPRYVSKVGEGYLFPLGIAYISSALKAAGLNVINLNLNHIDGELEDILIAEVEKKEIDVLLTGGLSIGYSNIKGMLDSVKKRYPHIKTIVGGGIITADPVTAMIALENADIGVIGEGERTIVELCNTFQDSKGDDGELSEIAGIIYWSNGSLAQTKAREAVMDLDSIPLPDYEGMEISEYLKIYPSSFSGGTKDRSFCILGSRSCPYQCTFCFHTIGGKYRQRSIESIKKEAEVLVQTYNISHIRFADELLSKDVSKVKSIDELSKRLGITWSANFRVDDINEEMIAVLKNSSCTSVLLGLESADNRILSSMKKGITVEQIEKALNLCREAGIAVTGNFIFGDINETIETATNTLDFAERWHDFKLIFINVYPGTQIYKHAVEKGIIKDPVRFLKDGCPNVNVSKLSAEDISYIAKRMMRLSYDGGTHVKDMVMLSTKESKPGYISIKGTCTSCGKEGIWSNLKLFFGGNYAICPICGQKHTVPFPQSLQNILLDNISCLLRNKRVAVWGVHNYTLSLFEDNDIFANENIVFVDNNEQKQRIRIHNKQVFSPDKAILDKIDVVLFFYPSFYAPFSELCRQKYPHSLEFYNVYDLLVKNAWNNKGRLT